MLGDERVVLQALVEDCPQHAAHKRQLRAGVGAQPQVGVPGKLDLTGVHHDELAAGLVRLLDGDGRDVVLLRGVAVDDQHAARVLEIGERARRGHGPEAAAQGLHKLGAMVHGEVNVVRAHDLAGELASQVGLLVRRTRREQQGEGAALVVGQEGHDGLHRLLPRRLNELAVLPQHGRLQAVAAVDKLVAELAHVAELPGVHGRLPIADASG